jgi:dTDP-4-amino-4,6-dideoxygalactose transaminase
MVVTQDAQRAEKLIRLRAHGAEPKYYHKVIGGNFRLDSLQAAVVSVKLQHLDAWTGGRQRNAERYNRLLSETGLPIADTAAGASKGGQPACIRLPKVVTGRHIFNQYVIRTERRDQLKAALQEKGVGTEIYYPVPLHLQECFTYLGYKAGAFPESEGAANETLALPIYPELSEQQARHVVQSVAEFYAKAV